MRWVAGGLLLTVALLQVPLWFGEGSYREVRLLRAGIAELAREVTELEERNRALEAEVADLKLGLDAIEERARSELGLVGEGETFVQILRPDGQADDTAGE